MKEVEIDPLVEVSVSPKPPSLVDEPADSESVPNASPPASGTLKEQGERHVTPASLAEAFDAPEDAAEVKMPGEALPVTDAASIQALPADPAPAAEVPPKVTSDGSRRPRSSFSLKAQLRPASAISSGDEVSEEPVETEVKRLTPFSQNSLETAWLDTVKIMEDRPVIHSVIAKTIPILEDDFRVRISVENRVQADYLEGVRDELVGALRSMLDNDAVRLLAVVEEGASNAKIVYTPEERFQFLLEKNPHLAEFRREFKLDLE